MRALIFGGTGLLGKALLEEWRSEQVVAVGSKDADVREGARVRQLISEVRPDWVILAAAYTDVDGCEKNPELAHAVNCGGAANVARAAGELGSRLLLLSTDYVFDGRKSAPYEVGDPVCPINAYGHSKAEAEALVRKILPEACIVRTAWLFGVGGKCFPNTILDLAEKHKYLRVVDDQRGCPTLNRELARAIIRVVYANGSGILHVTNSGDCSWFEFALELIRVAGLGSVVVQPISSEESNRPARRPKYSVLSHAGLQTYGLSMKPWQEVVRDYLEERLRMVGMTRPASSPVRS